MLKSFSATSLCTYNSTYDYVNIKQKQNIYNIIINRLYSFFTSFKFFKYKIQYNQKEINVSNIYNNSWNESINEIIIYDNCVKIDDFLNIPYEYIKSIQCIDNLIILKLVSNCQNINKIGFIGNNYMFKKLCNNMNYHVRYNQIELNVLTRIRTSIDV